MVADDDVKPWELTREKTALIALFITTGVVAIGLTVWAVGTEHEFHSRRAPLALGSLVGYVVYKAIIVTDGLI